MTIREWAEGYCYERGLFEDQARAVVDAIVADPHDQAMKGRWDDDVDGYPPQLRHILGLVIDEAAVRWIDANIPLAWCRPIFAHDAEEAR